MTNPLHTKKFCQHLFFSYCMRMKASAMTTKNDCCFNYSYYYKGNANTITTQAIKL